MHTHATYRYQRVTTIQRTGFVNQDTLDHIDIDVAIANPGSFGLSWGAWMWSHLPEQYAADNFHAAPSALKSGRDFENANLPTGHKFQEWTMEEELERQRLGLPSDLKTNGDWNI